MNWGGFHHPAMYIAEAIRLGIQVRGPHVNHSARSFSLAWEGPQPVLWMGLGWIKDLRRGAARAIVVERKHRPFAGLRDLATRVPLQRKELAHLVQCGALDGLGKSRAVLLAEGRDLGRAESTLQLSFDLGQPDVEPEPLARRVEWEKQVLGYPVSVLRDPLKPVENRLPEHVPLRQLPGTHGRLVAVAGVRLPGWTGREGFYLWDGETWVIVRGAKSPPAWRAVLARGRWTGDEWGFRWFQAQEVREVPAGR